MAAGMAPPPRRLILAAGWPCLLAVLCCLRPALALDQSAWTLPAGFQVANYYTKASPTLSKPRSLALSRDSAAGGPWITYVSSLDFGGAPKDIYALVDLKGSGQADYAVTVVKGLSSMPNGIAWWQGSLYIASLVPYQSCTIYRLDNVDKNHALAKKTAKLSDLKVVLNNLPIDSWHGWKFIRFGPDGKLYIPIGANCNVCRVDGKRPNNGTVNGAPVFTVENSLNPKHVTSPYQKDTSSPIWGFATIYRVNADGSQPELYASGVRNTVGFDWHPTTGGLYFTDNGRDDIGKNQALTDNQPDCELNYAPKKGLNFGFPYCHTGAKGGPNARPYLRSVGIGSNIVDPNVNKGQRALKCNAAKKKFAPAIQAQGPHTAPLGMRFYRWSSSAKASFPKEFDNNIFVAQHGSWNRNRPIGARVMRVVLDPANPAKVLKFEPFFSGGVPGDKGQPNGPDPPVESGASYNGRPVDVEQLPDGSLLVSDDFANAVYRITYVGTPSSPSPSPGGKCTVGGVSYDGCADTFDAGLPITHYYTKAGDKLQVAIRANTANLAGTVGWAAWAFIPSPRGGMRGADALIVRPCSSSNTCANATAYTLDNYFVSSFRTTTGSVQYSAISATRLQPSGELLVSFVVDWKPSAGGKMQIRYGGGPIRSDTLQKHLSYPVLACVTTSGGLTAAGSTGC